jgi:hypothetical protein
MQLFKNTQRSLAVIAFSVLIVGCASDPKPVAKPEPLISGESMIRESEGMAKIGSRWQNGKDMVNKGNAMIEEGQSKITEGHRLIDEGNKIINESEQQYKGLKK